MNFLKKNFIRTKRAFTGPIHYNLFTNDGVRICSNACACCWDKPVPDEYEKKINYLAKRAETGHTSIFEHSNYVVYLELGERHLADLVEVLEAIRYLETAVRTSEETGITYVLIGGTYAGYLHLYKNIRNLGNKVLKMITSNLYENAPSAPFESLIKDGIMEKENFRNKFEPALNFIAKEHDASKHIYIENMDDLDKFIDDFEKICPEYKLFDIMDFIRMQTITVCFKDMSRTATHQLVRHRNGITQESQRYVDYSKAMFASPAEFKPEKYDAGHIYEIEFAGQTFLMTLEEIGLAEQGIYKCLRDEKLGEHRLLKEDARAYLPGNIICRKLYMTFTYKMLFKFLELREDKAAQAEIRLASIELGEFVRKHLPKYLKRFIETIDSDNYDADTELYILNLPYYKLIDDLNFYHGVSPDVEIGDPKEESISLEDYMKANPDEFNYIDEQK